MMVVKKSEVRANLDDAITSETNKLQNSIDKSLIQTGIANVPMEAYGNMVRIQKMVTRLTDVYEKAGWTVKLNQGCLAVLKDGGGQRDGTSWCTLVIS